MKMNRRIVWILCMAALSLVSLSFADTDRDREIAHLLEYLKDSGCQFYRNGSWHSADEAAAHLNTKYQYLEKRGLADTAEKFIDRAATKSSMSDDSYMVKCGTAAPLPSAAWFKVELEKYRGSP